MSPNQPAAGPLVPRPLHFASLALLLALGLFVGPAPAAEERFENEDLGINVLVPEGWRSRYDHLEEVLLLGAPDGLRVLVMLTDGADKLSPEDVKRSYQRDGRQLKSKYGKVKVTERPGKKGAIGGREAFGYAFAFRISGAVVAEQRDWLAVGPSRDGGILRVHIRATAKRELFPANQRDIQRILHTFGWPGAPIPEDLPEYLPEEAAPASTAPPMLSLVEDQPGSTGGGGSSSAEGGAGALGAGLRRAARELLSEDEGYTQGVPEGHDGGARAYDRGSLQGGVGFMREAREIKDPEKVRRLQEAFRIKASPPRTEEEKKRAAAYLGFDLCERRPGI